ncbi:MAG: hypothetical protein WC707_07050 [Candidatus Babeliaceae bacterium]|jgi:hypothetical protein
MNKEESKVKKERGRPTKDTVAVPIRLERWLDAKVRADGKPSVVIDKALRLYYGVDDV